MAGGTRAASARAWFRAALAASLCSAACALSPIGSSMSLEEEIEEGRKAIRSVRRDIGLVEDEALTAYVRSIGERLAAHSPRQDIEYRFFVADREEVNAFAIPGGYIFVTRGLLALADSEDELANVLGHEIGHVAARHYATRSWRTAGGTLLAALGGIAGSFLGLSQLAALPGRSLIEGHNREQEREADELGQAMAAAGGWQPVAMTEFLRKLERDTIIAVGAKPEGSILDSHPATDERIEASFSRASTLPRSGAGDALPASRDPYLEQISGLVLGQDPEAGVFVDDELFLHPELDLRIRFPEDWTMINRPLFVAAVDPPVQVRVEFVGRGEEAADLQAAARAFVREQQDGPRAARSPDPDSEVDDEAAAQGSETAGEPAAEGDTSPEPTTSEEDPEVEAEETEQDEEREPDLPDFELERAGPRLLGRGRRGYAVEGEFLKGQGVARIYFLRVGDVTYQLTCAMPKPLAPNYMGECDRTARSMRTLRRAERDQIERVTLEVEAAREGETLREFGVRTQNHWTVSQTAAANGLRRPYRLSAGQRIKFARARAYAPNTVEPDTPEPDAETEAEASEAEASEAEE